MTWIFVDCEADGQVPSMGVLTEFGAVEFETEETFHGIIHEARPRLDNPALSESTGVILSPPFDVFYEFNQWLIKVCGKTRPVLWSDNPAFDFMWMADGFWTTLGHCPFGHSGRRISDFYAGLVGDVRKTQEWKRLRKTPHDHDPVHDAMGNVEAMKQILAAMKKANGDVAALKRTLAS